MALSLALSLSLFASSLAGGGLTLPVSHAQVIQAAPLTVTSLGDEPGAICPSANNCTLRAAIQASNTAGGGTNFILLNPGVYVLTQTEAITITAPVTILGLQGAGETIVNREGSEANFTVASAPVTISGVTFRNAPSSKSGLVNAPGASLTLDGVVLAGNDGYGIRNNGATLSLENSEVSGNSGGGLIILGNSSVSVTNTTISDNSNGSGIAMSASITSSLQLANVTISGNSSQADGGGINQTAGTITLRNTVVAGNTTEGNNPDCFGNLTSLGHNLLGAASPDCSGLTNGVNSDMVNISAQLGALADNGGPTRTRALSPGSPAIDAGANCATTDQRGANRPQGLACDIGAYELPMGRLQRGAFTVFENAGAAIITATLDLPVPFPVVVNYATNNGTAQAGVDYTAVAGSVSILTSTTTATFTIPITDNTTYNSAKWLNVTLSAGNGISVRSPTTATLTILDNEFGALLPAISREYNPFGEKEPNDSSTQATGPLQSGITYYGTNKGGNDPDFYFFNTTQSGTITVNVTGLVYEPSHPERNGQLQLRFGSSGLVGFAGAPPYSIQYSGSPGVYYVLIFTPAGYVGGPYALTVTYP